jgi:hypothetical protein
VVLPSPSRRRLLDGRIIGSIPKALHPWHRAVSAAKNGTYFAIQVFATSSATTADGDDGDLVDDDAIDLRQVLQASQQAIGRIVVPRADHE